MASKQISEKIMAEYIDSLPRLKSRQLQKIDKVRDTGTTYGMVKGNTEYIDFLKSILIILADNYSPEVFGKQSPEDFFSTIISSRFPWYSALVEPHGIGTGGTIASVLMGIHVINDIERMVEDMVESPMATIQRDNMIAFQNWKKRWRGKELLTINHNSNETSTDAYRISSKVAADLKKMQSFFAENMPDDIEIDAYQKEMAALLDNDFLGTMIYGFKRSGNWLIALKYQTIDTLPSNGVNFFVGPKHANISGQRQFVSLLSYSESWAAQAEDEKRAFSRNLPFIRKSKKNSSDYSGSWIEDKKYKVGGLSLKRYITRNI